jgi:hypothetical protein
MFSNAQATARKSAGSAPGVRFLDGKVASKQGVDIDNNVKGQRGKRQA